MPISVWNLLGVHSAVTAETRPAVSPSTAKALGWLVIATAIATAVTAAIARRRQVACVLVAAMVLIALITLAAGVLLATGHQY